LTAVSRLEMLVIVKIGENIASLRKSKGVKQEELAKHLGYKSRQTISDLENGSSAVNLYVLEKISEYFSVDITDLFDVEKLAIIDDKELRELIAKDGSLSDNDI